jgi:hypothetical protein
MIALAEMANAMGVEYVLFGSVGKLGNAYLLTLRLFNANHATAAGRETLEGASVDDLRKGVACATPTRQRKTASTPALRW